VLEDRFQYVQRYRKKLLADAQKDIEGDRARLVAHVRELPALRQKLLDARDLLTWAATYPDHAEQYGFPTALALGLREPLERTLQTKGLVDFGRVVAALEADADALAERHHAQVRGRSEPHPPARR
jgi:hypothetical protein